MREGSVQPVPRSRVRSNCTRLNLCRINSEVSRVLTDEVNHHGINTVLVSPLDPISGGRLDVTNPEATEKCRVHVVDIVFRAMVDSGKHPSLRVEGHGETVGIVAERSVQNDLEEGLLDLGH